MPLDWTLSRALRVCQWHDTSVAGHDIAEVQDAVQAVDVAQKRITELTDHAAEPAPSEARIASVYPLVSCPPVK